MKQFLIAALFWSACPSLFAQLSLESAARPDWPLEGSAMIQLEPKTDIADIADHWKTRFAQPNGEPLDFIFENIAPRWRIWAVRFDPAFLDRNRWLETALKTPGVAVAELDREVEDRTKEPDDPQFFKQWPLTTIKAPEAWEASTGGLTAQGDTIVVAVLEKGFFRRHPDLLPNIWRNWHDTPGDGIDNDQNGYVDDHWGWDSRNDNDSEGTITSHAAGVTGIIGAVSDNGEGIAGINWNIKLMTLSNSVKFSEITQNYYYVADQRRLYNETNGQKGAFVVATNASFGANSTPVGDGLLWCQAYDSLGRVGVLSFGATANAAIDTDVSPDLPSQCPSEFLVVVTNVDKSDNKVQGAGYGQKNVDLGAPGDGSWSAAYVPSASDTTFYSIFGGTSAATPHVTGTAAWLASLPCPLLMQDSKTAPVVCARRLRDMILNSVEPLTSLKDITKTGGRLSLYGALTAVRDFCGGTVGNLSIQTLWPNPVESGTVVVQYETPDFSTYSLEIFNVLGQKMAITLFDAVGQPFRSDRLSPKEFSLKQFSFDASALPNGPYFLVISNAAKGRSAKLFVKR